MEPVLVVLILLCALVLTEPSPDASS